MISDYYFVRKGHIEVNQLYSADKTGPYYFNFGFSWHAYAAYICGILINIVGFAGAVGGTVPKGATYIYNFNYFTGSIIAAGVYYILTRLVPIPDTSSAWNEFDSDDELSVTSGQEAEEESVEREDPVMGTKDV